MNINEACAILAQVHTKDDDLTGFRINRVQGVVLDGISPSEYFDAWKAVREFASRRESRR